MPLALASSSAASLLADDDDESLARATPSDVDAAIAYLLSTFPHQPPSPSYLEPRLLLVSQLYALVSDRTAVDREVDRRRRAGEVRVMRAAQLGVDELALVTADEYAAVVRSMWRAGAAEPAAAAAAGKAAAGEERKEGDEGAAAGVGSGAAAVAPVSSLLGPNSQPIRRKRPRVDATTTPPRPPLSPSARQPSLPSPTRPATAPSALPAARHLSLATASAPPPRASVLPADEDKENAVLPPAPVVHRAQTAMIATAVTAAAVAAASPAALLRSSDMALLLDTLLHSFLPAYTDLTITRSQLLAHLHAGRPYRCLSPDDVISALFRHQLLAHSASGTAAAAAAAHHPDTAYLLTLPHTAHLLSECLAARAAIVRLVEKTRYKQVRRSELEARVRLPCTERGVRWHVLEMIGSGRLVEVDTTQGVMLRVNADHQPRRGKR